MKTNMILLSQPKWQRYSPERNQQQTFSTTPIYIKETLASYDVKQPLSRILSHGPR